MRAIPRNHILSNVEDIFCCTIIDGGYKARCKQHIKRKCPECRLIPLKRTMFKVHLQGSVFCSHCWASTCKCKHPVLPSENLVILELISHESNADSVIDS